MTGLCAAPPHLQRVYLKHPSYHGGIISFAFSPNGRAVAGGTGIVEELEGQRRTFGGDVVTLGDLGMFVAALFSMYHPVKRLAKSYNNVMEAMPAAERIFELIDAEPSIQDDPDAIELKDLRDGLFRSGRGPFLGVFFAAMPGGALSLVFLGTWTKLAEANPWC